LGLKATIFRKIGYTEENQKKKKHTYTQALNCSIAVEKNFRSYLERVFLSFKESQNQNHPKTFSLAPLKKKNETISCLSPSLGSL
jgi:hypothetical protein